MPISVTKAYLLSVIEWEKNREIKWQVKYGAPNKLKKKKIIGNFFPQILFKSG